MGYVMKQNFSRKENYGSQRNTNDIKWLVIHYTSNDGDSDESNGKYFAREVVKASAHYFVDDDSVTQSVPDNYAAYAVGGNVNQITTHIMVRLKTLTQFLLRCAITIKRVLFIFAMKLLLILIR